MFALYFILLTDFTITPAFTIEPAKPVVRFEITVAKPRRIPRLHYRAAVQRSLDTGKPLLTWVGGNFCERCVNDSKDEFIHHFADTWGDAPVPSIVIEYPENGVLHRVAVNTQWIEGDPVRGHIGSSRTLLARWKEQRKERREARQEIRQAAPVTMQWQQPAMPMYAPPMMRMSRGGRGSGC